MKIKFYKEVEIPDQSNCAVCPFFYWVVDFNLRECKLFDKGMEGVTKYEQMLETKTSRLSAMMVYTYVEPLQECKDARIDKPTPTPVPSKGVHKTP